MNNRILKILGISDADENNDALSNRIRKKLEEAENHPVDAGKSLYEYDRNGETVFARIEKFTDEQSTTWCVTDVSQWWNEINRLREQSSRDSLTLLYNRRALRNGWRLCLPIPELLEAE